MVGDVNAREIAGEKAKLLMESGQFAEANALYLRLSEEFPKHRQYKIFYVRTAIEACRDLADPTARRRELRDYVLNNIATGGDEKDRAPTLRFLAALGAWEEGAELLRKFEKECTVLRDIDTCFRFIPRFTERGERAVSWRSLLADLRRMRSRLNFEEQREAAELELKLLLAMERFPEFVSHFDRRSSLLRDAENLKLLEAARRRLAKPRSEGFAEPRVFGIGLSRTGTTSLAIALSHLGLWTAHWTNPLTHQILSDTDFYLFDACTDCSVSPEFERLYHLYPNAKFVFTQRNVDDWAQSFWSHHRRVSWAGDMPSFQKAFEQRPFADAAIEFALYNKGPDIRDSYRAFETRVRNFFADKPKDKLLDIDICAGQGWPELCAFLGKPVPEEPFPLVNASAPAQTDQAATFSGTSAGATS
ncbi:MAG TPA: sulfotransferase [Rhizomicrobium sp.]|nr:sulfotransferase [Rhizomicrobium sp.]